MDYSFSARWDVGTSGIEPRRAGCLCVSSVSQFPSMDSSEPQRPIDGNAAQPAAYALLCGSNVRSGVGLNDRAAVLSVNLSSGILIPTRRLRSSWLW